MRIAWLALMCAMMSLCASASAMDDSVAGIRSSCRAQFAKADHRYQTFFSALLKNEDPARDTWIRQTSKSGADAAANNGNSTASLYEGSGRIAVVAFSFRNQFGDWINDAQYCFRPDGSLAQIHSQLDSFHGDTTVIRDYFFSKNGKQLAVVRHDYALHTTEPKKPEEGFWDFPPPLYRQVDALPFARQLQLPKTMSHTAVGRMD